MAKAPANAAEVETDDQPIESDKETEPKAGHPAEPEAPAEDDVEHPDDAMLREAREAVEAEQKGEAEPDADGKDKPDAKAEPAPDQAQQGDKPAEGEKPAAPPEGDTPADTVTIPKARFDEVLRERDNLALQNAYLKGVAESRQQRTPAGQPDDKPAEPEKSPADRIAEINTAIDALAKQFDDGEISMSEFKQKERALEDEAFEIRKAQLAPPADKKADEPASSPDLYLDQLTEQLEKDHPYTLVIQQDEAMRDVRWNNLMNEARASLASEGVELIGDPRSTYELRRRMAELTDTYGPVWYPDAQVASQPGEQPGSQTQQPSQQQAGDGLTPRQRGTLAKVEQARAHPPDTLRGGSAENDEESLVKAAAAKLAAGDLDDDEILAMPESVRAKIRGGSW